MTAGRGYMALAAMIFGKWHPVRRAAGPACCSAFSTRWRSGCRACALPGIGAVPVQAIQALPYVMTVVLLAGFIGRARAPKALGRAVRRRSADAIDPPCRHRSEHDLARLVDAARAARRHAHAPYSKFTVGAALLDEQGRMHAGCNVENAAYPQGLCAEAVALAALVLAGGRRVRAAVVVRRGAAAGHAVRRLPPEAARVRRRRHAGVVGRPHRAGAARFTLGELLPASFGAGSSGRLRHELQDDPIAALVPRAIARQRRRRGRASRCCWARAGSRSPSCVQSTRSGMPYARAAGVSGARRRRPRRRVAARPASAAARWRCWPAASTPTRPAMPTAMKGAIAHAGRLRRDGAGADQRRRQPGCRAAPGRADADQRPPEHARSARR